MEQSKCHGCGKEDFKTSMYSLGKKWKHKRKIYGTFIYVCEKCYSTELEKFTSDIEDKGELIVCPPIKEQNELLNL
jgi:hypothetical protein